MEADVWWELLKPVTEGGWEQSEQGSVVTFFTYAKENWWLKKSSICDLSSLPCDERELGENQTAACHILLHGIIWIHSWEKKWYNKPLPSALTSQVFMVIVNQMMIFFRLYALCSG